MVVLASVLIMGAFAAESEAVPLRSALEEIGMVVEWSENGSMNLLVDDLKIGCSIGMNTLSTSEKTYVMSSDLFLEDDRSYISVDGVTLIKNIIAYNRAVIDSIIADQDEILPLKSIDTDQEVLVCTWHRYPDSYQDGEVISAEYGEVWVFTAGEIEEFMQRSAQSEDMVLRLEQLIGLPPQKGNTHFSYLWVSPKDLFRPAPDNEITDNVAQLTFPQTATSQYKNWFNANSVYSYQLHKFPWTRLGYTYDWSDSESEYGLSEFIVKAGSSMRVEKTYTNGEFFANFS